MRILIIEDDKELAMTLKDGLTQYGLICDISNYGKDGEEKALVNEYDAILLDLNLPDKDGIDILKYLRNMQIPVPIVIVTARDDIAQRARDWI